MTSRYFREVQRKRKAAHDAIPSEVREQRQAVIDLGEGRWFAQRARDWVLKAARRADEAHMPEQHRACMLALDQLDDIAATFSAKAAQLQAPSPPGRPKLEVVD